MKENQRCKALQSINKIEIFFEKKEENYHLIVVTARDAGALVGQGGEQESKGTC